MSDTFLSILLAIFLLTANAFFVAAEFALVKTRGFRMDALAEENRFGAKLTQHILRNLEPYLACCQLGITMASLGLGWVGEPAVAALLTPVLAPLGMPEAALHFTAFLIGFLLFSSLHIVLGEQVPKTLAIREPEPVSLWIAYPLHITYMVFFPLNWLLNGASRSILRMLGVREASHQEILTDVEIEGLVEVSAEHGKMEESQAEFIHNLFRLGELEVSDVMIHRTDMHAVNLAEPNGKIVDDILASPFTRVPLWEDEPENIVGVVHTKDLVRAIKAAGDDIAHIDIRSIAKKPWFVPDTTQVTDQLNAFLKRKSHFALVVDEYGEVLGLVTLEDIIEEIIGEFTTTAPGGDTAPQWVDDEVTVDGAAPLRELNRRLGTRFPLDGPRTLNGLLLETLRELPEAATSVRYGPLVVEIQQIEDRLIRSVRLRRRPFELSPHAAEDDERAF